MRPPPSARNGGHLEFPHQPRAQGCNGLPEVRGAMVRVEVIAYTPTEFLEEMDVTIGPCRELAEANKVTWVNVVDPDGRTLGDLETRFGWHRQAREQRQHVDPPA